MGIFEYSTLRFTKLRFTNYALSWLLAVLFLLRPGNAQEIKPKPVEWKIKGAVAAFADANPKVRAVALDTLRELKALNHIPAQKIAELLKDPEEYVRSAAAGALGNMCEAAKEQAPKIAELLKDPDAEVRSAAAQALRNMGPLDIKKHTHHFDPGI